MDDGTRNVFFLQLGTYLFKNLDSICLKHNARNFYSCQYLTFVKVLQISTGLHDDVI